MKKHVVISSVFMCLWVASCSITMQEKHVLFNDEGVSPISESFEYFTKLEFPDYQFRRLEITHSDHVRTRGIALINPNNTINVLYYGGNLFNVEKHAPFLLPKLVALDVNVFWFDHRGRGASEGRASGNRMLRDVLDQFDYVSTQVSGKPLIVHGVSLGSFLAGHIAENRHIDGLVLEASVTNVDDLIETVLPDYMKVILNIKVDEKLRISNNARVVSNTHIPLLIIGSELDKTTPPQLSAKLFDLATTNDKELIIVEGAQHGNAMAFKTTIDKYHSFLDKTISQIQTVNKHE